MVLARAAEATGATSRSDRWQPRRKRRVPMECMYVWCHARLDTRRKGAAADVNSQEIHDRIADQHCLLPVSASSTRRESDWTSDSRARSRAPPSVYKRHLIRGLHPEKWCGVYFPQSRYPACQRWLMLVVLQYVCAHHRARGWQCRIADTGRQPRCRMLRLSSCSRPLLWSSPSIPRPAGTRGSTRHVAHILNTIRATTTGHIRTFSTARSFRT